MANPTSLVTSIITVTLQDIQTGVQVLGRTTPPILFKAINVQYQGFVNLATSGSIGFTPVPPVTLFAVAYVRNVGPSQVQIQFQVPGAVSVSIANLDANAMFLYAETELSGQTLGGSSPGISQLNLFASNSGNVDTNVEVLLAG